MAWHTYTDRLIGETGCCLACGPEIARPYFDEPVKAKPGSLGERIGVAFSLGYIECPRCAEQYNRYTEIATESIFPAWDELKKLPERRTQIIARREQTLANYELQLQSYRKELARLDGSPLNEKAPDTAEAGSDEDIVTIVAHPELRTEPIGTEQRIFNNLGSDSASTETLHISQVASFHLQLDDEDVATTSGTFNLGPSWLGIKGSIEQRLLKRHGKTLGASLEVDQTSTIVVPARRLVRVVLEWKRYWEDGNIIVGGSANPIYKVPYHMTTTLSYDKTTLDESKPE